MSTAILMSGQFRTLLQCLNTQHWHVYRHFPDVHFFLVMQKDASAAACVKALEDKYGADHVHCKLIDDPTDLPMIPLAAGAHAPYANAASHKQLMMQHFYQNEVWKHFEASKGEVDFYPVIRMRADNYFHSADALALTAINPDTISTPWWGQFGGINDRFAICGNSAAKAYFTVYEQIDALLKDGCPFHPESLSREAVVKADMDNNDMLDAIFSTWRLGGNHRPPEIQAHELARFAGRNK